MIVIPSIADALETVVEATSEALAANTAVNFGADLPKQLYFRHGNLKEITEQLTELGKTSNHRGKKYPFVALFRDTKEELTAGQFGATSAFNAKLGIFALTDSRYNSQEREERIFKPILRPILGELIQQIIESPLFKESSLDELAIEKWDCFFYGSSQNNKNPFNDHVDAIEVSKITLTVEASC